jgi:hypothetical protein
MVICDLGGEDNLGFIIEIIFGTIIDGIFELWTNFMKKGIQVSIIAVIKRYLL